jgi:hypothetical protein
MANETPSDFPGGKGESLFAGRAGEADLKTHTAKAALGFAQFSGSPLAQQANEALLA